MHTKINKILFVETLSDYYYPYQNWYLPLKKVCNKIINFDFRKNALYYGSEVMNKMLLDLVKKEKPDFMMFWLLYDEFSLETLLRIRQISPKTKTLVFFGDDDIQFESFSRYYALFFDYCLLAQPKYELKYKKEGINTVFSTLGVNTDLFKHLNINKIYDVVFIGHPKSKSSGRYDFIKYLKDNGINIKVGGWGWDNYPDLQDIYLGALSNEDLVKTINQTKINLCFTKNNYGETHLIGKVFESKACKSFVLTEYGKDYGSCFKEWKEIIMFKDKEDLLKKVEYYLKNETQREKIANLAHKRILKDYNIDADLSKIFNKILKENKTFSHSDLPKLSKRHIILSEKDIQDDFEKIKLKLESFDYIGFKIGNSSHLKYKNYLQVYSLLKSGKLISCCDYYVNSKSLGNYLALYSEKAFNSLEKSKFDRLITLNQLMVKKQYFLDNFEIFKKAINNPFTLISKENTVFISIPLVKIEKITLLDYDSMKKAFIMNFLYQSYSLKNKSKKQFFSYNLFLLSKVFSGQDFILRFLIETLLNKDKWKKFNKIKNLK